MIKIRVWKLSPAGTGNVFEYEFEINDDVLSLPEDINFDTKVILEEKLKLISDKEREIVVLKDIYGYKLKEIAEIKNMNLSTVKSVYYKALKDMGGN